MILPGLLSDMPVGATVDGNRNKSLQYNKFPNKVHWDVVN